MKIWHVYGMIALSLVGLFVCAGILIYTIFRYQELDYTEFPCIIVNGTVNRNERQRYYLSLDILIFNRIETSENRVCVKKYNCEQWLEEHLNQNSTCLYSHEFDDTLVIGNPYLATIVLLGFFSFVVIMFIISFVVSVLKLFKIEI